MVRLIVSVKDSGTGLFMNPFYVVARGQAIRAFSDEVNRRPAETDLARHPEDFELYLLGEFDESGGRFTSHEPVSLIRGKDVVNAS